MRPEDSPTRPLNVVPSRMARHQRPGVRRLARHLPVVGWVVVLLAGVGLLTVSMMQLGDAAGTAAQAQTSGAPASAQAPRQPPGAGSTAAADPEPGAPGTAAPAVPVTPPPSAGTPEEDALATHRHGQPGETADADRSKQDAAGGPVANGLQTLGRSCEQSSLEPHTGFEEAPGCVGTAMGEVPAAEDAPQLLIVSAPDSVGVGEPFILRVSSRNLVRDRFLAAADGGYYIESSFLDTQGLVRGHFHTGCRHLSDAHKAPDPTGELVFFAATEDGRGGEDPDVVEVTVPGIAERGVVQCAVWAGDGSHRIPMTETARMIPAVDAVRLVVR